VYDIGVALRRFKGLIRWAAHRYEVQGSYNLSFTDLEAEGMLLLVECCRAFPSGQPHFSRYFKRSLYNRLQEMRITQHTQKRTGTEVELDNALGLPTVDNLDETERMQSRAKQLFPMLTPHAQQFLKQLLDPDEIVVEHAWRDFCRRNKLHSQGKRATGWNRFRIKFRHIRSAMHLSKGQMRGIVNELRTTARQTRL
jgi:hypothetical protein